MFQFILINVNKVFAFLFFCFIYSAEDSWWILSVFTQVLLSVEKAYHNDMVETLLLQKFGKQKRFISAFQYLSNCFNAQVGDPNKRQADHLARHSVKYFINLMSSYCMLQRDTQLITFPPSQAASSNHYRHAINILKWITSNPQKNSCCLPPCLLKFQKSKWIF